MASTERSQALTRDRLRPSHHTSYRHLRHDWRCHSRTYWRYIRCSLLSGWLDTIFVK
jgi:hypothetical protein